MIISTLSCLMSYSPMIIVIIVVLFLIWIWRKDKKEYPFEGLPSLARHEPLPLNDILEAEKIIETETKLKAELARERKYSKDKSRKRKQKNVVV
jgi:hypothetical protein